MAQGKRTGPGKQRARKHGTPIYGDRYTDSTGVVLCWSATCARYLPLPAEGAEGTTAVKEPPRVIGIETTYTGHEKRYGGHGARVKVTAILVKGRHLGSFPDDDESGSLYVTDDHRLLQLGGIQPGDGAEVHCWLPGEGRWGFVGYEIPDVSDLAIFADLKPVKKAKK